MIGSHQSKRRGEILKIHLLLVMIGGLFVGVIDLAWLRKLSLMARSATLVCDELGALKYSRFRIHLALINLKTEVALGGKIVLIMVAWSASHTILIIMPILNEAEVLFNIERNERRKHQVVLTHVVVAAEVSMLVIERVQQRVRLRE